MTTTAPERSATRTATRRRSPALLLRKIAVAIAGLALMVAGVAMLVLPGPGIVAILAGLGLLGTEFPTARRLSTRLNGYAKTAWHKARTLMPAARAKD
ncbi:PGPGW domain-containing protein [Actinomadura monticuli]|uniref:PGPGW domain-containing protein n=1 Tax=Actinomadura monticuli TaxID=3097367 RepID=A0ABV4Q8Y6_9ACTN